MMRDAFFQCVVVLTLYSEWALGVTHVVGTSRQCPSIQAAIDLANDGDIVLIPPGQYHENINLRGKGITVAGSNPSSWEVIAGTVICGQDFGPVVVCETGESANTVITGLTIAEGKSHATDPNSDSLEMISSGLYCYRSSPTILNNIIRDNGRQAQFAGDNPSHFGGGISCYEASPVIRGNIIKNNTAYFGGGISVFGFDSPGCPVITNNLVLRNSAETGGGVFLEAGLLVNNTMVADNASSGANVYIGRAWREDKTVSNNIIAHGVTGAGVMFSDRFSWGNWFSHNNVWGNPGGNYEGWDPATDARTIDGRLDWAGRYGNICVDPMFVDQAGQDYHLHETSACRDRGNPNLQEAMAGQVDLDGNPRVIAGRIDIGADEYYQDVIANAGPDQQVSRPQAIRLSGTQSYFRSPSAPRRYAWRQSAGPRVALDSPDTPEPSFTPREPGEYEFELKVGDQRAWSSPAWVTVTVHNRAPVAHAGQGQSFRYVPQTVTLDGSLSSDPDQDNLTYLWRQIDGPAVVLDGADTPTPSFVADFFGRYIFELVVGDGDRQSEPAIVEVYTGNRAPVAHAGPTQYVTTGPVLFDGTDSSDPDGLFEKLTYQWRQTSGPTLNMKDANTASPMVRGFSPTLDEIQRCRFELTVSDGGLESEPDAVEIVVVRDLERRDFDLLNPFFDPSKPTIVAFGDLKAVKGEAWRLPNESEWRDGANILTTGYEEPYDLYGDLLIHTLSRLAPKYTQPVQVIGAGEGGVCAVHTAVCLNTLFKDPRYVVTRVSLMDVPDVLPIGYIHYLSSSRVKGKSCWVDNYRAKLAPFYETGLNIRFADPPARHDTPYHWYEDSTDPSWWPDEDYFNDGIYGGWYMSVAGPAKNLHLSNEPNTYSFKWDTRTDSLEHLDVLQLPASLPEPVVLLDPHNPGDYAGVVLTCLECRNAVSYELLVGPTAHDLRRCVVLSTTAAPPSNYIVQLPFDKCWWTIRVHDAYGSTIHADPRFISRSALAWPVINPTTSQRYMRIQDAIHEALDGDVLTVGKGMYYENVNLGAKHLSIRSTDPNNPSIVAATVINGSQHSPTVTFNGGQAQDSGLAGLTLTGGWSGVYCQGSSPTFTDCIVIANHDAGMDLVESSSPALKRCFIGENGGPGLSLYSDPEEEAGAPVLGNCIVALNKQQGIVFGSPTLLNCTVVENCREGILLASPIVLNSIIYFNGIDCGDVQIGCNAEIAYSDVQGGWWQDTENIDLDPLFVRLGSERSETDLPRTLFQPKGDYHLMSRKGHWDQDLKKWVNDELSSPCIDAGPPESSYGSEPAPNGMIINLGAYGGTAQASKR